MSDDLINQLSLVLAGNEPRQRYLFDALATRFRVPAIVNFDDIDAVTKLTAAALSLSWPRSEWWENYQMHSLVQGRRRRVLARHLKAVSERMDALLMWGSWFKPSPSSLKRAPFFCYIDQSRTLANLPGEKRGRFARRRRSHELQTRTYESCATIFCMSEWARDQTLESHGMDASKLLAVGWGPCSIDLSSEDLSATERQPVVLHVSNDFYRKGIDYLMATAERVRAAIPEVRFVVIGEDVGGAKPTSSAYVQFLGRITDRAILTNHFRKASIFFLPHRFDRSPHVLVEAMSAGLPLVASAQGGAIELIKDRGTGFLAASGDIEGYTEAIVELLQNQDLRKAMSLSSQKLMRRKYNWPTIASRMGQTIAKELAYRRMYAVEE